MDMHTSELRRRGDSLGWKILGYLLDILVIGLIALCSWMVVQIYEVKLRVGRIDLALSAQIETMGDMRTIQRGVVDDLARLREWRAETSGNRFTSTDGKEVWKEIAAIREQIATMPNKLPPTWFVERVDKIDSRLAIIEQRIIAGGIK